MRLTLLRVLILTNPRKPLLEETSMGKDSPYSYLVKISTASAD
jgi:hypothetical protein